MLSGCFSTCISRFNQAHGSRGRTWDIAFRSCGLFLLVNPSGTKVWRMKYQYRSYEKLLSFGPYEQVPLVRQPV